MQIGLRFVWFAIAAIELVYSAPKGCEPPTVKNGVATLKHTRGPLRVDFECNQSFEMIGSNYAECSMGNWSYPAPLCATTGCTKRDVENGFVSIEKGHTARVKCDDGFLLVGHQSAYCDGMNWNQPLGACWDKSAEPLFCDFETDMCGWRNYDRQYSNWQRSSITNDSLLRGGPGHDHTTMQPNSGHFIALEWRKNQDVISVIMKSPVYPTALSKNACFQFWYNSFGDRIANLKVYAKPDPGNIYISSYFHTTPDEYLEMVLQGDGGNEWKMGSYRVPEMRQLFIIIIKTGTTFTGDGGIVIDDIKLVDGPC